jgi:hypothetical protein
MKVQIRGVKELDLKLSRFHNFLGEEYNRAMKDVGQYGTQTFRNHINQHRSILGSSISQTIDLESNYKDKKLKRWGKIYPILRASDKMYNDIKYFMNIAKGAWESQKIKIEWGFDTARSAKIAFYHHIGILTKKGRKIRDPFFISKGEQSWITRLLNEATRNALKKARLK